MEYVSVLAGEPFSDRPGCTHPTLAALAQMVNDAISDSARPGLVVLAPDLIGAVGSDPRLTPALVARCARNALAAEPASRRLRKRAERAVRCLDRMNSPSGSGRWGWFTAFACLRPSALCAVREAVLTIAHSHRHDRDELLHRLLADAIADLSRYVREGAVPTEDGDKEAAGSTLI